jgi:hypothetical protein
MIPELLEDWRFFLATEDFESDARAGLPWSLWEGGAAEEDVRGSESGVSKCKGMWWEWGWKGLAGGFDTGNVEWQKTLTMEADHLF